jgi:hypothetical protein
VSAGDLDEGLLDHLVVEFFDHGRQAVEFLRSAQALVSAPPAGVPRVDNVIAYCLREAMKIIPASQDVGGGGQWRTKSRSVVDAKRRYELTRGLPGEDSDSALRDLLTCIDDMALTHQEESIHQKRLIAVIVNRTGAQPLASGVEPVRVYQDILTRLDEAVHPGHREVGIEEARQLWTDCVAILRQLFLPPEVRHRELDVLAAVDSPGPYDVSKLVALLAGPNHLHYFLSKIQTPAWLDILAESTLLEPPTGQAAWPVFAAVTALKDEHGLEVAAVLMRMMEEWGSHPQQAFYLTQAGVDLGAHGREVVLCALGKHRRLPGISNFAVLAASRGDPSDDFVESVAEIVLDRAGWDDTSLYPEPLLHSLVAGLTSENYATRIKLLCYKLRKVPQDNLDRQYFFFDNIDHLGDEIPPYRRRVPFYALLETLVESLKKALEWAPFDDLLQAISPLPDDIKNRVRPWLLGTVSSVEPEDLISEVAGAISSRYPTSDDLRVVDRAVIECDTNEYVNRWSDAVGTPPTVAELSAALAANEVPSSWRRVFLWSALLPPQATTAWTTAVAIMSAAYGQPSRETLEQSNDTELSYGHSPLSDDDMRAMQPDDAARWIAAWRPDPSQRLASARALGRTLQAAVKADTASWITAPLTTAALLRHPTYIHHYLQGLAEAEPLAGAPVDDILDLIVLVRAHPWEAITLGDNTFDFDPDWRPAEHASIDLIKAMAASDTGFGNRRDEVWAILYSEIGNHSEPSGIGGDTHDPLETAINRPCTRALEAALSFLAHEYRLDSTVRPDAIELLTSILQLEDRNGAEHRAILAPRLGFLRHIAPDWVEQHRDQLFGDAAPTGLGQVTVDLAIRWGQPNRWLLESYPDTIKDAVKRNAEHALDHYLIAMLWDIPGYSLQDSFTFLKSKGLLSTAVERLGRLLRAADTSTEPVDLAVQFWKLALAANMSDSLAGFGWFAEIDTIATDTWTDLTLQTVTATRGRIDWAHKVAERAAAQPPTTKTLDILNQLVRGLNDDWDRQTVAQLATQTLNQAQHLADTPEYKRIATTLAERNAS